MGTFLFESIVFGPVFSRRLGQSLGLNILPVNGKFCNFNCVYCECGLTNYGGQKKLILPSREEIRKELELSLKEIKTKNKKIDTITFAGNGEPTIHPQFTEIIDDTIDLRNQYLPGTHIAVLSNATMVHHKHINESLNKIDLSILKLDSAFEQTIEMLNCPQGKFNLKKTVDNFKTFGNKLIIQTLFIHGEFNGNYIDNTTQTEVDAWVNLMKKLNPSMVMIYTIERDTPYTGLKKASPEKLNSIAEMLHKEGIKTQVSY